MTGTTPWQATDAVEPIQADTIAALANIAGFNVVSGCAASYSGVNMQVTIAAGVITHTNAQVAVAGNTVTLVSDPMLPRWAYIYINSSGVAVVISGTPAAAPSVPDTGANPGVALVYVQAALTVASNATYRNDKRVFSPNIGWQLVGYNTAEQTTTSTSRVDLVTISGLSILVSQPVNILVNFRKDASAAQAVGIGLKLNSTNVCDAAISTQAIGNSSATQQAEAGFSNVLITPRSANYLVGVYAYTTAKVLTTGIQGLASSIGYAASLTNPLPNATITSVTIEGINGTTSNNLAVKDVLVYAGRATA